MNSFAARYWWTARRVLPLPIVNNQLSAGLAAVSLVVLVAGWTLVGVVVVAVGGVGFVAYGGDRMVRWYITRKPEPDQQICPRDFKNAPSLVPTDFRFVAPSDAGLTQLYPYVDLSHHSDYVREENTLSHKDRLRLYGRWYDLCPRAFLHLEKLVAGEWRPIAVSIMFPLSPAGFKSITRGGRNPTISVVDLDAGGIAAELSEDNRVLLIDTWIVDRKYKGAGHGKTTSQGGFANALVLRHIAEFWNSGMRFPSIKFLVETNNGYLIPTLCDGFHFKSRAPSKIGVNFYDLETADFKAIAAEQYERVIDAVRALEATPILSGTASPPAGWSVEFPSRN
ncbi:MAG: hypothetical protein ACLP0J_25435 [Solirubrobacteraceae bacterium]